MLNGITVEKTGMHVWNLQFFSHLLIFVLIIQAVMKQVKRNQSRVA